MYSTSRLVVNNLLKRQRCVSGGHFGSLSRGVSSQAQLPRLKKSTKGDSNPGSHERDHSDELRSHSQSYVSNHFVLPGDEVVSYLKQLGVEFKLNTSHAILETCPFCHDTKGIPDNEYKLHIFRESGGFHCFRCGAKGSWFQFRNRLSHGDHAGSPVETIAEQVGKSRKDPVRNIPSEREHLRHETNLFSKSFKPVLDYLRGTRGLSEDTLRRFRVGACEMNVQTGEQWQKDACISFPMFNEEGQIVRQKMRQLRMKGGMRLMPKGGKWGLFGLNAIPEKATEVVVTEGELDAMSVWQATGMASVSIPNGASSLPIDVLPLLERFQRIYLWMDADAAGEAGARQFARKLGLRRVLLVPGGRAAGLNDSDGKDANDYLRKGVDLSGVLKRASVIAHEGVVRFDELREKVFEHLVSNGIRRGVQCQSLPGLNKLLKGHRRGELTILSGHTGIGKTTLLSQLSLDYCMQGVTTLWGSFEIGNVKLASDMLVQMFGALGGHGNILDGYDEWADRLGELPLLFLKYEGSQAMDVVLDAMEYSNYVYDCSHYVLDNLQFMTYGQGGRGMGRGWRMEKLEVMDEAVSRLRRFASKNEAHVTLVVHPRKEGDDDAIQLASVFGSAKATQEADNVILLQRSKEGVAHLEVKKNRYDGQVGRLGLRFDRRTKLFRESDRAECGMRMTVGGVNMKGIDIEREGATKSARKEKAGVDISTSGSCIDNGKAQVVASSGNVKKAKQVRRRRSKTSGVDS